MIQNYDTKLQESRDKKIWTAEDAEAAAQHNYWLLFQRRHKKPIPAMTTATTAAGDVICFMGDINETINYTSNKLAHNGIYYTIL